MSEADIRPYQPADLQRICDIAAEAWRPYFEGLLEQMGEALFDAAFGDWRAEKTRQVRQSCRDYPQWCLVSEMDGEVVGFCTYRLEKDRGLGIIGNNAVAPQHQGGGIGTRQYHRVLEAFEQAGIRFAKVTTGLDPFHAPARKGYQKAGFERFVEMVDYYREI
jgi:RimJ/RimL family protein N-acetyltransferase